MSHYMISDGCGVYLRRNILGNFIPVTNKENGDIWEQRSKAANQLSDNILDEIFQLAIMIKKEYPMLRFQQIISIAAKQAGWENDDLFYCPDETVKEGLQNMLSNNNWAIGW